MPTPPTKRIYSAKDAVMLTVLQIILKNAQDQVAELTVENENWNATLIAALQARVNKDFTDILGLDPKKDQREATALVKDIQAKALPLLSTITLRLNLAIKDAARRAEILTQLGITGFGKAAQKKDQIALVELLTTMKTNLTPALKAEITATKDIKATLIDELLGYATTLYDKNVNQESLKLTSKVVTADGIIALNATYAAVVTDFSRYVFDFYKKQQSVKKELFNFAGIKKVVNADTKKANDNLPPATPK